MSDQNDGNESQTTTQSEEGQTEQVNPGAIRKSTTQSLLSAFSNASGTQFNSVEEALAYMARVSAQKANDGDVKPQAVESQAKAGRMTNNDLSEQFSKLQSDLARKDQILRERDLDSEVQRAMGDKFDPDLVDYALQKVRSNIQWNDDGSYAIINSKGQERFGTDGNPLTLQGLVQEVAKGNPKLLKGNSLPSGSGLRPGQGQFAGALDDAVPDYARDPAAFNAWASKNGLGKNIGLKGINVSATASTSTRKIV